MNVKETQDRLYIHYEITGTEAEVEEKIRSLHESFPSMGYGTVTKHKSKSGGQMTAIVTRWHSCD